MTTQKKHLEIHQSIILIIVISLAKKRDSVQPWTHENWSLLDSSNATTMDTTFDPTTFLNDNQAAMLQLQDLFGQDELDFGGAGDQSLYYDELTFGVYCNISWLSS